jgi:hypothetical protein
MAFHVYRFLKEANSKEVPVSEMTRGLLTAAILLAVVAYPLAKLINLSSKVTQLL